MPFDFPILYFIQENIVSHFLNGIMVWASALGEYGAVWLALSLVLMCSRRTRTCGILMVCAMALCFVTGELITKNLVCRLRPCYQDMTINMLVERPHSYSFPSGHSSSSFAASTVLCFFYKKAGIAALAVAAVIAFSRLYLFVHFPTDVFIGILWGILGAMITIFIYKKTFDPNLKGLV